VLSLCGDQQYSNLKDSIIYLKP